jgi:type I restriction enzyme R subunit
VRIYYESRLAKVRLKEEEKETLDQRFDKVMEDAADYETGFGDEDELNEKAKAKWTRLEAIVGNRQRVENVARDLVAHFEERQKIFDGKEPTKNRIPVYSAPLRLPG